MRSVRPDEVVDELARDGGLILYTPDSVLTLTPSPLLKPHIKAVWEQGVHRGRTLRRFGPRGIGVLAFARAALILLLALGAVPAFVVGGGIQRLWFLLAAAYVAAVLLSALAATLRFDRCVRALYRFPFSS